MTFHCSPESGFGESNTRALVPVTRTLPARVTELLAMLTYRRPADSESEREFIQRFIVPTGAVSDGFGNYWHTIGDAPILWSAHTDTVHRKGGIQRVSYGAGKAFTDDPDSSCLGADDTTGCWILLQMIRAGIQGIYIFHRSEEIGGLGSDFIRVNHADKLAQYGYAVAFDRKGYSDVLTHQGSARCCSDAFAESLASAINKASTQLDYETDSGGIFTDTANYVDVIPECTNIAVGYFQAHTAKEYQDVDFACLLADAMCAADLSTLVCERDPTVIEYDWHGYGHYANAGYRAPSKYLTKAEKKAAKRASRSNVVRLDSDGSDSMSQDWLDSQYGGASEPDIDLTKSEPHGEHAIIAPVAFAAFVLRNPGLVADFLTECGYGLEELQSYYRAI